MTQREDQPITPVELQPLEPRLLLSGFPLILEQLDPHDTMATAQDISSAIMVDTTRTDTKWLGIKGTRDYAEDSGASEDWYVFEIASRRVLSLAGNAPAEVFMDSGEVIFSQTEDEWQQELLLNAGSYFFQTRSDEFGSYDYRFDMEFLPLRELNWQPSQTVDGALEGTHVGERTRLEDSDEVHYYRLPKSEAEDCVYAGYYNSSISVTRENLPGNEPTPVLRVSTGTYRGKSHYLLKVAVGEGVPLQGGSAWTDALDVTNALTDMPTSLEADRGLWLPLADDDTWFSFDLDEHMVLNKWWPGHYVTLYDSQGNRLGSYTDLLEPGTYLTRESLVMLQRPRGHFEEVSTGLWQLRGMDESPFKTTQMACEVPVDMIVDPSDPQIHRAGSWYVEAVTRHGLEAPERPTTFGYEITKESGHSSKENPTTLPLQFIEGREHEALLVWEVDQQQSKDSNHFRVTLPNDFRVSGRNGSYSSLAAFYNLSGDYVGEMWDVIPGGTYDIVISGVREGQWVQSFTLRRMYPAGGPSMDEALDLDDLFETFAGRRQFTGRLASKGWVSFTAQAGDYVHGMTVYDDNGESLGDYAIIPATGRYFMDAWNVRPEITIEKPIDRSDEIAGLAPGETALAYVGHWQDDAHDRASLVRFRFDTDLICTAGAFRLDGSLVKGWSIVPAGEYYLLYTSPTLWWNRVRFTRPTTSAMDLDPFFVVNQNGESVVELPYGSIGRYNLTVGIGQKLSIWGPDAEVFDENGLKQRKARGAYYLQPGTYYIERISNRPVKVTLETLPEAVLTESPFPGVYNLDGEGQWFIAEQDGVFVTRSQTRIWTSYGQSNMAREGDVVYLPDPGWRDFWVTSTPQGMIGTSIETATPLDDWIQENEYSKGKYVHMLVPSGAEHAYVRFEAKAGDYMMPPIGRVFNGRALNPRIVDAAGNEITSIPEDGTYYGRIDLTDLSVDGEEAPHVLFAATIVQGALYTPGSSRTSVYLEPGGDMAWDNVIVYGDYRLYISTDYVYTMDMHTVSHLFNRRVDSSFGPERPVWGRGYIPLMGTDAMRYVVRLRRLKEREPNNSLEEAQDMTGLLEAGPDGMVAEFETATDGDVDWFKFHVDDYSTVKISANHYYGDDVKEWPYVELYDGDGLYVLTEDSHIVPGWFYVKVRSCNRIVKLRVEVSQGTPYAPDANDVWSGATDITALADGQEHTVEGLIMRPGETDWYVIDPGDRAMYVVTSARDRFVVRDGELVEHTSSLLEEEPLYIRVQADRKEYYSFTVERRDRGSLTLEPTADPDIMQVRVPTTPDPGKYTIPEYYTVKVPIGYRLRMRDSSGFTERSNGIGLNQPHAYVNVRDATQNFTYRESYASVFNTSGGELFLVADRLPEVDLALLEILPGPQEIHRHLWHRGEMRTDEFAPTHAWFRHTQGYTSLVTGRNNPSSIYGAHVPDVAHFFRCQPDAEPAMLLEYFRETESEPNDSEAEATRVDDLWNPWGSEGQRLVLAGEGRDEDRYDYYVFSAKAGEAIKQRRLDPDGYAPSLEVYGEGVENHYGMWFVKQDTDVYVRTFNRYRTELLRGPGVDRSVDYGNAKVIGSQMEDDQATLVGYGYVTFLAEPGAWYRVDGQKSLTRLFKLYSESGEELPSASRFFQARDRQVILHIDGGMEITKMQAPSARLEDLLVEVEPNLRQATFTYDPDTIYTFQADPNEIAEVEADFGYELGAIDREPQFHFFGEHGTDVPAGQPFMPGGRFYTDFDCPAGALLTVTVRQTEPVANNSPGNATDLDDMFVTEPTGSKVARIVGALGSSDTVDYYRVHLEEGEFISARLDGVRFTHGKTPLAFEGINASRSDHRRVTAPAASARDVFIRVQNPARETEATRYVLELQIGEVEEFVLVPNENGIAYGTREVVYDRETWIDYDQFAHVYRIEVPEGRHRIGISSSGRNSDAVAIFNRWGGRVGGSRCVVNNGGVFYVAFTVSGHGQTRYSVSYSPAQEPDAVLTYTVGEIQSVSGNYGSWGDVGWRIDLDAGQVLTMGQGLSPDAQARAILEMVEQDNNANAYPTDRYADQATQFSDGWVQYKVLGSGSYRITAKRPWDLETDRYEWQFLVSPFELLEPNDTKQQAIDLTHLFEQQEDEPGKYSLFASSEFLDSDTDWWRFDVPGDCSVLVDIYAGRKVEVEVYDTNGRKVIDENRWSSGGGFFVVDEPGTVYVKSASRAAGESIWISYRPIEEVVIEGSGSYSTGTDSQLTRFVVPDRALVRFMGSGYSQRRLLNEKGQGVEIENGTWFALPDGKTFYAYSNNGYTSLEVLVDDPRAAADNHSLDQAYSIDHLYTRDENGLGRATVYGFFGWKGRHDFYALQVNKGDAIYPTGVPIDRNYEDEYVPEFAVHFNGVRMASDPAEVYFAPSDGVLTIETWPEEETNRPYKVDLYVLPEGYDQEVRLPHRHGTYWIQEPRLDRIVRWDGHLQSGEAVGGGLGGMLLDADYRVLATGGDTWTIPETGTYHMLGEFRKKTDQVRPKQLVYVDFDGGAIGNVPELDVDLGALAGLDPSALGLSANANAFRNSVLGKIRGKFEDMPIQFIDTAPESLPFSKLYISNSTPVEVCGLGMVDHLNQDMIDDAYVFAPNVLNRVGDDAAYRNLSDEQQVEALANALANVASAYLAQALGALPMADTSDLLALERWDSLTADMQFSETLGPADGHALLQNTRHVLETALSTFTPGVVLETHRNDQASQAEAVLLGRDVARPMLMGSIDDQDVDHYAFQLGEGSSLHLSLGQTAVGAQVEILDGEYRVVAEDADGDGRITQELPAGLYYVRLTSQSDSLAPLAEGMSVDSLPPSEPVEYLVTLGQSGDATGDGLVNMYDFLSVRQNWLKPAGGDREDGADVNGDGMVNMYDFLSVRQNWLSQLPLAELPDLDSGLAPLELVRGSVSGMSLANQAQSPAWRLSGVDVIGQARPAGSSAGLAAAEVDLVASGRDETGRAVEVADPGRMTWAPVGAVSAPSVTSADRIESGRYVPQGMAPDGSSSASLSRPVGSPLVDILSVED